MGQSQDNQIQASDNLYEEIQRLKIQVNKTGQKDIVSLLVFSGDLDKVLSAFVIATGAAAMGSQVNMFFSFWATAALRKSDGNIKKAFIESVFGKMLPKGISKLPLSKMNILGVGQKMMKWMMKKKNVPGLDELLSIAEDTGVNILMCEMSMNMMGFKREEIIPYKNLSFCGVTKFLDTASEGKITLFI